MQDLFLDKTKKKKMIIGLSLSRKTLDFKGNNLICAMHL